MPTKFAVLDIFPLNFFNWIVKYSFSKFSLASFNGIDRAFSVIFSLKLSLFKDSLIILEILWFVSGCKIATLSIRFLNSLTFPCQLWFKI